MDVLLQDLRYGCRALARTPGFTAIALAALALGTGANTAVFSFVNALLLRPPQGVTQPAGLVRIYTSDFSSGPFGESSVPDYLDLQAQAPAFSGLAAYQDDLVTVRWSDDTHRVRRIQASGNYFGLLGVVVTGRAIQISDALPGARPVAVISDNLWRTAFASNPAAIGATVTIDGLPHTIVGVATPRFRGLEAGRTFDIWTPLVSPAADLAKARGDRGISIIGRLAPGVTLATAQVQVSAIADRLARSYPATNLGTLQRPKDPREMLVRPHTIVNPSSLSSVTRVSAVLMGAVALVLLIACANVANLLLARGLSRRREIAVRLALGATRRRIVRQLLNESVVLGLAGGAAGFLLSMWTADVLPTFFPAEEAASLDVGVDARVLTFAIAAALASGLVFGLAPALQALRDGTAAALKDARGGVSAASGRAVLRSTLVIAQVGSSLVLLIAAGLFLKSLANATRTDLGFAARNVLVASVEMPPSEIRPPQGQVFYQELQTQLATLPGVESAGLVRTLPLGGGSRRGFRIEGYRFAEGEPREFNINIIAPGYFATMQIPLLAGRDFTDHDAEGTAPVAIVNDALARKYFGGEAIGRHLRDSRLRTLEIVGVVRTGKYRSIRESAMPMVYYPLAQEYATQMTVVARTTGDPLRLAGAVRAEARRLSGAIPVFGVRSLSAHLDGALGTERLTATLVGACGFVALALATIGVYGVVSYAVSRRTQEIGIRIALGAAPGRILRLVLGGGLALTSAGLAVGLAGAMGVTRFTESLLFGVTPHDTWTFAFVTALLLGVALLATYLPARRAMRVDPVVALRQE